MEKWCGDGHGLLIMRTQTSTDIVRYCDGFSSRLLAALVLTACSGLQLIIGFFDSRFSNQFLFVPRICSINMFEVEKRNCKMTRLFF